MIAKGTTHNNGARLAAYLVTSKDGEEAHLHELRGFAEDDIVNAFRSVHVIAEATRCEKPFYHCQVRTPSGEELTVEQWMNVAERIEAKLGLTDQPRAVAFHDKDGHTHMHVAWSRIDEETMTAKELKFDHLRLKEACRELEVEMNLTPVRNSRDAHEAPLPERNEFEEARRLGVDIKEVRNTIRACQREKDGGVSFAEALAEHDMRLAKGDRRDYVVVDPAGGLHALGKRLLGIPMPEIREYLSDLDRDSLPTITEARDDLQQELFLRPQPSISDVSPELPEPELGPWPDAGRAVPYQSDGFTPGHTHEFDESLTAGMSAAGNVVGAVADVAAKAVEKGLDTLVDVVSFGAASSTPEPKPGRAQKERFTMKPDHEPREIAAQQLRTAHRDTASRDPSVEAAFHANPGAATPDLTQQILNRWRLEREKERERER